MAAFKDNGKVGEKSGPVQRGGRYYLLLLVLILWGTLFLFSATVALNKLSLIAFLAAGLLLYSGLVLRNVYRSLNPIRSPLLQNPLDEMGINHDDIVFQSCDGLMLSGWFVPSKNGATVILTHGIGGNRLDMMPAASHLIKNGFGVLMYDMRAHGRSSGNLGTWGWVEVNDLNGAVSYLQNRTDVDSSSIGAMGFSLGGQISIRAAAINNSIKAVIAEDPSPAVITDHPMPAGFSWTKLFNFPGLWLIYNLQSAVSGVAPPAGILDNIGKITPRPLLMISSSKGRGQELIHAYFESAGEPKELWEVPDARHGWIFAKNPEDYQSRICGFFRNWLLAEETIEYT
jgi:fermentation-respiration switch protein FrsA (DUF1100 family)